MDKFWNFLTRNWPIGRFRNKLLVRQTNQRLNLCLSTQFSFYFLAYQTSSTPRLFLLWWSGNTMPNWELKNCCKNDQVVFLATIGVFTVVILVVCFLFSCSVFQNWSNGKETRFRVLCFVLIVFHDFYWFCFMK